MVFRALWQEGLLPLQWAAAVAISMAGAATDLHSRRVPNWLTGPAVLAGLTAAACMAGLSGLADAAIAMVMLATPYILLFALARGGAGDAKLMAAIGAWLGVINGLAVLAAVSAVAVVFGVVYAARRRRLGSVVRSLVSATAGLVFFWSARGSADREAFLPRPGEGLAMPYAPVICAGVCAACMGVLLWRLT